MNPRLSDEEIAELGRAVVAGLHRVGFCEEHDPRVQPAMLPAADLWLERWATLLREHPASASGPLASLLAEVHEATIAERGLR